MKVIAVKVFMNMHKEATMIMSHYVSKFSKYLFIHVLYSKSYSKQNSYCYSFINHNIYLKKWEYDHFHWKTSSLNFIYICISFQFKNGLIFIYDLL